MRTWQESMTILSISKMYKDKVIVCGVNDQGKWVRINNLSYYDLGVEKDVNIKIFGRSNFTCYENINNNEDDRPEDCYMLKEPKPLMINEISRDDRAIFIKNYLDGGVEEAFKKERTLGLIRPLIEQVYFGWNDLYNTFESYIIFQDKTGQHYKFVCSDLKWYYSWIYLFQRQRELLYQELNQLPHKLNQKNTYFVVGLSKTVHEIPGAFNGRWPLILGIHSF